MNHRSPARLALTLLMVAPLAFATGCASELDANAFFPKTYATDYAKITACEKSGSHGGKYVATYVNKEAEAAFKAKTYPFAEGTVFVKVGHSDSKCTDITAYWAMKQGDASVAGAAGNWVWQELDADGQIANEGQLAGCTGCHSNYKDNDYVGTLP